MATNGTKGDSLDTLAQTNIIGPEEFTKQEYDYLILGGGTAGLTIAARLSENPDVTVGVIEAGKNKLDDPLVDTPAMFPQMFSNPDYDWKYMTTPQIGGSGERETEHHMVRGRMLGGSSGINYMMYVRGSNSDYDDWATIIDDKEWSSENMKQYMRKHETLEPIDESVTDRVAMPFVGKFHGTSGPIHTSFNPYKFDIEDDVIKAADHASGYTNKPMDPWSGDHIGFYETLASISRSGSTKGKRSYAMRGYVEANTTRPNLKVTTEALIAKIVLDGNTATGATFKRDDQEYTANARREVIVCCGTIASPQLLELSGIGDPDIIKNAGLECKIENRAIGENLQDHVITMTAYEANEGIITMDSMANPEFLEQSMKTYQESGSGPLSCTSTVQGFFPVNRPGNEQEVNEIVTSINAIQDQTEYTKRQRETVITQMKDKNSAALQMVLVNAKASPSEAAQKDQSTLFLPLSSPNAPNGITIAGGIQYPVSRGSVHTRSSNPEHHPALDPGYLTEQADINQMALCLKFLSTVAKTEPLASKLGKRTYPDPEFDLTKIEDCRKAVMAFYIGGYHPIGSVAIGDALDSRLRVKGAQRLRVADASVFPGNVSGNIMSTVYMVGEKAADIIKEDWDHAALRDVV